MLVERMKVSRAKIPNMWREVVLATSKLPRTKKFHWAFSLVVVLLSTCFTALFAEVLFRALLFSETPFMRTLKRPEFFANEWDSDYFKLRHFFEQKYQEPSDKLLGWRNFRITASSTYAHIDDANIGNRTPVLLYGDSFAECTTCPDECFQDILNRDTHFSGTHYLLNYGVGGYGVDQTYLLYQKTIANYQSPIVVIGVLNYDLDRNITPVTWGLKPFFTVDKGNLQYHNSHLRSNVDEFFKRHPPTIVSYLWRLAIHEGSLPGCVTASFKSMEERRTDIQLISRAVLLELSEDLKRRNIPHVFVIFEWSKRMIEPPDWRVQFLVDFFRSNHVDFIMAREALVKHEQSGTFDWQKYTVSDGHPNALYNRLVSEQILHWLWGLEQQRGR